jgi:hypothetical protein
LSVCGFTPSTALASSLNVAKQHRNPVHRRKVRERIDQALAHLSAHDLIVGER